MDIHLIDPDTSFAEKKTCFQGLLSDSSLNITRYKVEKGHSMNISIEYGDKDDNEKLTHFIFVMKGSVKVTLLDASYIVKTNATLSIVEPVSYNILTLEDCDFIFLTTSKINNDINLQRLDEMSSALAKLDPYTKNHTKNVLVYSEYMANLLMPKSDTSRIHFAASYFDIGKLKIPENILNKPSSLTAEEYEIVKKHPEDSYELLKPVFGEDIALLAKHHHEMLDGSGYPDHLYGNAIDNETRILAVADVFDALTSARSYRKAYSFKEAFYLMNTLFIEKLDQKVVFLLKDLVNKGVISSQEKK
jgi:HD-GYP domain-containing protein (c-di-GMP phosphodiesterase class II)